MKLRNWIVKIHGYIGVIVGLLIAVIGLTGSVLVFHEPLAHALSPAELTVIPQEALRPIEEIVTTAREAVPDGTLNFMRLPEEIDSPYYLSLESKDSEDISMYVNPYTGGILGIWHRDRSFVQWILAIHSSLLAGEVGEITVGLCGLLLLILSITGFILWPGWRKLSTGYKIRWRSARKFLFYDLHKVAGIAMGVFLALTAFTGAIIVLLHFSPKAIALFIGPPSPEAELAEISANSVPLSLSQILQKVGETMPGSQTNRITFAGEKGRKVTVYQEFPNDPFPSRGLSNVKIDAYTGQVLSVKKIDKPTFGTHFGNFIIKFHFGIFAGIYSQILYVFVGMTPTLLFATGFVLWRQRQWAIGRKKENQKLLRRAISLKKENQADKPQVVYSQSALPSPPLKARRPTAEKRPLPKLGIDAIDGDSLDDLIRYLGLVVPPEGISEKFK